MDVVFILEDVGSSIAGCGGSLVPTAGKDPTIARDLQLASPGGAALGQYRLGRKVARLVERNEN